MMGFALSMAFIRLPMPPPMLLMLLALMLASMVSLRIRFSKASAAFLKEGSLAAWAFWYAFTLALSAVISGHSFCDLEFICAREADFRSAAVTPIYFWISALLRS